MKRNFKYIEKTCCIYAIKNNKNGKIYIGSAVNARGRFIKHVEDLNKNKHHSYLLQNDWNEFGEKAFCFSIIEKIKKEKEEMILKEQLYFDFYNPEYNILKKAYSSLGFKHKDSDKNKMSDIKKKDPRTKINLDKIHSENKIRFSGVKNPFYGKKHSEETRDKIRLSRLGKPSHNLGKKMSDEQKRKISESKKGTVCPEWKRELLSKKLKGRCISPEHRMKISVALKKYKQKIKNEKV